MLSTTTSPLATAESPAEPATRYVGRGAGFRPANPYERVQRHDDWEHTAPAGTPDSAGRINLRLPTLTGDDVSQSIVNRSDSPDLPFRWTVNPYRGCMHGCAYCYARPTHEFLGLDAGLGFETRIFAKREAPKLLRQWLRRPGWAGEPLSFSGVTDCYQPLERRTGITRACIEVAAECRQPIGIVTKNRLVTRDKDLLGDLARDQAAVVAISLTTLDAGLASRMEPRTSSPEARLEAMAELSAAGVPTHAMISPIIPGLNDQEIPALLAAAREAGAASASYSLLRLSGSTRDVFLEWLRRCEPNKAPKVEALIRGARNGRLNDTRFGKRMSGVGPYAGQIARTFRVFARREGLELAPAPLSSEGFRHPAAEQQLALF